MTMRILKHMKFIICLAVLAALFSCAQHPVEHTTSSHQTNFTNVKLKGLLQESIRVNNRDWVCVDFLAMPPLIQILPASVDSIFATTASRFRSPHNSLNKK